MDRKEAIDKVIKYKTLLSHHFDLDKVVLFGSYAKDNQAEDSDIDVAVIVDKVEGDYFTYVPLLWKLRREIDYRIAPILLEKDKDQSGFIDEILRTGVIITG